MNKQLMISVINAAKEQLSIGDSELSLRLGHHRSYISRVLHQENPTTEQITKVVDKLNALIGEQKLPCGKPLPEFKHTPISYAVMVSKEEYDSLKKELDHKNQVLDKRNAVLENHIERVNELELQLKTTQQKFIDVVDQKDKEIAKINGQKFFAEEQLREKKKQIYKLDKKLNNQAIIYMIIIAILFIASIVGFAS